MIPSIDAEWPPALYSVLRPLEWIAMDWPGLVASAQSLQCIRPVHYFDLLEGALVLGFPILLSVPLQCGILHLLFGWCSSLPQLASFRARCNTLYLLLLLQTYAPITEVLLKYFACSSIVTWVGFEPTRPYP